MDSCVAAMCLAKGERRGDLVNTYKYLKDGCQEDGPSFVSAVLRGRTRGNGHKLQHRKFNLSMRRNLFAFRVVELWTRMPKLVVDYPFL